MIMRNLLRSPVSRGVHGATSLRKPWGMAPVAVVRLTPKVVVMYNSLVCPLEGEPNCAVVPSPDSGLRGLLGRFLAGLMGHLLCSSPIGGLPS